MTRKIILASTSPRRKILLEKTGLEFEICPSNYEEDMTLPMPPAELVKFLSKGKAESLVSAYPDALIIGSDVFISYKDKVLGKPHTVEKAKEMLQMLRGVQHSVFTGFAVIDTKNNKVIDGAVETKVYFKNYSDEVIDDYIKNGDILEKAGAYAIQNAGEKILERFEGNYDDILGLPVKEVLDALKEFDGYEYNNNTK